jgi:uncharacterized RDD family membrane protein YckC
MSTPLPPPPPSGSYPPPPPSWPPAAAQASTPLGTRAGFGARLGAYLLDGLLYGLVSLVFLLPAVVLGVAAFADCELVEQDIANTFELVCPPGEPDGGLLAGAIGLGIVGTLFVAFIYLRALGKTGQTWGRRIVGIKVVRNHTGAPIGFGRALGRQLFANVISGQIIYLGYLWMLWDAEKQTWHDKVVDSVVVRT